ncbi:MAG: DUF3006 domain-containing protein [Peptococcaceae bacterium]|nr:DUF3006 domain-containing protein [Peptococcaceae bacterium]
MKIVAVVDRIAGDIAVLLVGGREIETPFPLEYLPPVREGMVLEFCIIANKSLEEERRREAKDLLSKLKRRPTAGE